MTLALAGHGGLLVVSQLLDPEPKLRELLLQPNPAVAPGRRPGSGYRPAGRPAVTAGPDDPARRMVLQVGVLAAMTFVAAAFAAPLRLLGFGKDSGGTTSTGGTGSTTTSPASSAVTGAGSGTSTGSASDLVVAKLTDFASTNGVTFTVPSSAPSPLPANDPGIIVKLADGSFVAYDGTCPHEGCAVGWDQASKVIQCPCHRARFDPANKAQPISGPARSALSPLPISVNKATGEIRLTAG